MAQRLPETLGYMSRGAEATATDRWLDLGRRSSENAVGAPSDGQTFVRTALMCIFTAHSHSILGLAVRIVYPELDRTLPRQGRTDV